MWSFNTKHHHFEYVGYHSDLHENRRFLFYLSHQIDFQESSTNSVAEPGSRAG